MHGLQTGSVKIPRKKMLVGGDYSTRKFNIVGLGSENLTEYKHCPLDPSVRLIRIKGELKCPTCGYIYRKEEAVNEQAIQSKHAKQQTVIVSGKRKKRYYDKQGNEINDPDLIADIQRGANVISYHEEKQG